MHHCVFDAVLYVQVMCHEMCQNSSFTDDLSDPGPLTYIPSLTIVDEQEEMVDEYPEHDMPGEFHVSLTINLLGVTTEDIKQLVAIQALKQMPVFQEGVAI